MASFILVHGAFQGSWVWKGTAERLRKAGHDVLTPNLTGLGERSHLLHKGISLTDYIDDIVNCVCFAHAGPSIFVGHSFSGLLVTAAAARLQAMASALVYVDALIPEPGTSFQDMAGPKFATVLAAHVHDGWLVKPWPLPMFGVVEPQLAQPFATRLTSTPLSAFTTAYDFGLPQASLPRAFIRCLRNENPLIAAQATKAKAADFAYQEIDSGHAPMVTAPDVLAQALLQCASSLPLAPTSTDPAESCTQHLLRVPPARSVLTPTDAA